MHVVLRYLRTIPAPYNRRRSSTIATDGVHPVESCAPSAGPSNCRTREVSKYCPYTFGVVPTGSSLLGWY